MEVATGFLVPSYLYIPKMGPLDAQEGLETELMTETDLVADTGPGRPVRLKWSSHWSSGAKMPIRTKNGASLGAQEGLETELMTRIPSWRHPAAGVWCRGAVSEHGGVGKGHGVPHVHQAGHHSPRLRPRRPHLPLPHRPTPTLPSLFHFPHLLACLCLSIINCLVSRVLAVGHRLYLCDAKQINRNHRSYLHIKN